MTESFSCILCSCVYASRQGLPQFGLCVATVAHPMGQRSSAPSSSTPRSTYHVFISFHSLDTRTAFTAHLWTALEFRRIRVYRDDENLPRGEVIQTKLMKGIESSRIAVVVFSRNVATSEWCLDELVKIMDCKSQLGQKVLPVFYNVNPSEVREQTGNFAQGLLIDGPQNKVSSWRNALREAANLAGEHLTANR